MTTTLERLQSILANGGEAIVSLPRPLDAVVLFSIFGLFSFAFIYLIRMTGSGGSDR